MYWDRFDIVEAYYVYMTLWHGGQSSREYRLTGVFRKIRFRPSPFIGIGKGYGLSENGRAILAGMLRKRRAGIDPVRDRRRLIERLA